MKDLRFTLDTLMDASSQLRFATLMGWDDVEQMLYYEELAETEYLRQVQALPPPPEVLCLARQDPREVYDDMAGVY